MNKLSIFYLIGIFILSGCAHASLLEEGVVAGKEISLNSEKCLLTIDNKTFNLEMKPRCYFVKQSYPISNPEKIGVKYYADIDAHVILIVGTSAPKDSHRPLTLKRNDCGKQLQALIIKKSTALLSDASSIGLACAGIGVDEKSYWIFSHQ